MEYQQLELPEYDYSSGKYFKFRYAFSKKFLSIDSYSIELTKVQVPEADMYQYYPNTEFGLLATRNSFLNEIMPVLSHEQLLSIQSVINKYKQ